MVPNKLIYHLPAGKGRHFVCIEPFKTDFIKDISNSRILQVAVTSGFNFSVTLS
jgi:hypothetical protein